MSPWIAHHQALVAVIATWFFNNIITVMVSSLPAPTGNSSANYIYWFKVLNTIIGNLQRAKSTALELSPNWDAAVQAHIAKVQAQAAQLNSVAPPIPLPQNANENPQSKP